MLKPGGRLIVAESCVPRRFYPLEKAIALNPAKAVVVVGRKPAAGVR